MWNRKHFLWYYVFSSQMRHLCCSLCILVYKNADVDNFYSKSSRSMAKIFISDLKGIYNVFCETVNIFCDITYFPHKCATFLVPFVFWFTKMLTLTIFNQNRRGVWLKFLYRSDLKWFIMCFVEQKTFSVILRIFLTNAPPLLFPLYFGIQKCWRWQFLLKIVEEYG